MKKIICLILIYILGFNTVMAEEIARLYLVKNTSADNVKKSINPAFNRNGYNLINDNDYFIYEHPAKNLFNIILLKNSGEDCYYYYLSNEGLKFNKYLINLLSNYNYAYKRIKNSAFLDLFYNEATDYMASSKSSIKTVSNIIQDKVQTPQDEEYDFSDEAQARFDGKINPTPSQIGLPPLSATDVLTGSVIHLSEGTQFNAVLSSGISSESITNNDLVSAQLMENWTFNGIVIAPAGSILNGNVVDAKPASFAMGNGRIGLDFYEILTPEGKIINLTTNKVYIVADKPRGIEIAKRIAGGVLGGVAVASLAMLFGGYDTRALIGSAAVGGAVGTISAISTKGEDIDIPEGTNLQIILAEPMTVQPYISYE